MIILGSCIEPVTINHEDYPTNLIVEGRITTDRGPHSIRLTKSAPYGSIFDGTVAPVTNATVSIKRNDGEVTILNHIDNGYYSTPADFRAEVGKSYVLLFEYNGNNYQSYQEEVMPLSELEEVKPVFAEHPYLNESNTLSYNSGVDIYAKYTKSDSTSNYNMWEYSGVYYINTFPELYIAYTRRGPVSMPKTCCADCYKSEESSEIMISSFDLGATTANQKLFFLEDDGYRFYDKYVLTLNRYSMTQKAYQFYKLVEQQLKINGDIFDPPPATISGNIINIDNLDELVVGYFSASQVTTDTLVITSDNLDYQVSLPVYPDDCRVLPNTTTTKPSYY